MISKMEISSLKDYLETNEESEPRIAKGFLEDVISMFEEIQQYRAIGTVEEIKDILQIISDGQDDIDESGISTGLLHTLLEYAEYKKIGTVEECREARERQRVKKRIKGKIFKSLGYYQCPICGDLLMRNEKFCSECGQAILQED